MDSNGIKRKLVEVSQKKHCLTKALCKLDD